MSRRSGQEVAKQKAGQAKTSSRYWTAHLFRNTYNRDGGRQEIRDWCARVSWKKRRETFNLGTPNQAAAAAKAAALYKQLLSEGWDAVIATYKPKAVPPAPKDAPLGEFVKAVEASAGFRASTFTAYTQALSTVAAGIAGIGHDVGRSEWRKAVDALPLGIFSLEGVQRWRLAYIAKAGPAPDARRRAESTATSLIRSARALFSAKALAFVRNSLVLPSPLPFAGIKLEKKTTARYHSRIDASELIAAARTELAAAPASREQFKLFCLALLCGLRKSEADTLLWRQVDLINGQIRIEPTEYFIPKSEDSIGEVDVDPEFLVLLQQWKANSTSPFVVESSEPPRYHLATYRWYRCNKDFSALYAWLQSKGIDARKPLHELRKELGAILASDQGIFAAQRVLRHAQISTTASYYTDKKRRITAGLGSLLNTDVKST